MVLTSPANLSPFLRSTMVGSLSQIKLYLDLLLVQWLLHYSHQVMKHKYPWQALTCIEWGALEWGGKAVPVRCLFLEWRISGGWKCLFYPCHGSYNFPAPQRIATKFNNVTNYITSKGGAVSAATNNKVSCGSTSLIDLLWHKLLWTRTSSSVD